MGRTDQKPQLTRAAFAGLASLLLLAAGLQGLRCLGTSGKFLIKKTVNEVWDYAEHLGLMRREPAYVLDYQEDYPELQVLQDNYKVIAEEVKHMMATLNTKDIMYIQALGKEVQRTDVRWQTYFLNLGGEFIAENTAIAPKTTRLLKQVPDLYQAFFSILNPGAHIKPHWGYYKGYMRYHLGLIVPNNNEDKKIFLRVNPTSIPREEENKKYINSTDTVTYYWKEGEGVLFDDLYLHEAVNEAEEPRVVLFLDVARKFPWYLDWFNKFCLAVAHQDPHVKHMREIAVHKPSNVTANS